MVQQGFVMEIVDKTTAKIKITRHSACASCGKCATTSESKDIIVEVDNTLGARVGDKVEVNMETINVLKAAMIVYLIPLTFLLMGTIASYYGLSAMNVGNIEIISGSIGLVCMGIVFMVLKKRDSKLRQSREFIPIVTKIILF